MSKVLAGLKEEIKTACDVDTRKTLKPRGHCVSVAMNYLTESENPITPQDRDTRSSSASLAVAVIPFLTTALFTGEKYEY